MRLLMLNGNTHTAMTDAMVSRAGAFLAEAVEIRAETAEQGVAYIASRRDCALAGATLVANLERQVAANHDAVLLACFGEPGLAAARELSPVPVVGLLEAQQERLSPDAIIVGGAAFAGLAQCLALMRLAEG